MNRSVLCWSVVWAALLAPTASFAQISCTRDGLQAATNLYIAAQAKGDPSGMPLAQGLAYMENQQVADIKTGVIQKPLKIDFHRSLIDPSTCQTFTEVIVVDKSHPYVLGTRLRVNHDKIVEIESMVTQEGDWLFNADNYIKWSPGEDWGTIPAVQRDTRGTLIAAANAYLDAFLFRVENGKLRYVHTLTHVPPGRQVPRGPQGGAGRGGQGRGAGPNNQN